MLRVLPWLLGIALTVYAAVDCIQTEEDRVRNLPKLVWVFLILLFAVAGPLAWFIAGRPKGQWPTRGPGQRPSAPRGPDDDPDFLRNL
ncbi:Phospholipase_D-nuclease N-terminal [Pedococcus cremeus]|uniref:Phospholipase_D-nuclease N-terminal n=1 Tax=Pedococcus cremeus TaxID=587636 RepID=A0A1H9XSR4_9MICO|nr:PLD nuclease N-terminal domain-containing protein [Pedococcus cremeus]SES49215.1 Phospholipase_D-nuclease N-terminal [Pedococcus cremeus]